MSARKDWTGQKYGRLTFVRISDKRKNDRPLWELQCECGGLIIRLSNDIVRGNTKSCGCLRREQSSFIGSIGGKATRKFHPIVSSARRIWQCSYKDGDIDFDKFFSLSQLPCEYCGALPANTHNAGMSKPYVSIEQLQQGTFTYNGLDRIDSAKGHTLDNVVPCCARCNWMKGDMTRDEFVAHIERVYEETQKYRR